MPKSIEQASHIDDHYVMVKLREGRNSANSKRIIVRVNANAAYTPIEASHSDQLCLRLMAFASPQDDLTTNRAFLKQLQS